MTTSIKEKFMLCLDVYTCVYVKKILKAETKHTENLPQFVVPELSVVNIFTTLCLTWKRMNIN